MYIPVLSQDELPMEDDAIILVSILTMESDERLCLRFEKSPATRLSIWMAFVEALQYNGENLLHK